VDLVGGAKLLQERFSATTPPDEPPPPAPEDEAALVSRIWAWVNPAPAHEQDA
jgi:hypothetical protein